ncbi:hypothetical protein SAMN05421770_11328 [Granulicella rosea]|uniref:Uncharacterized protein n=1 Tax=Granulicella rosea TaxID=474952 RepID=A0A239MHM0_9BACT|nr:hypothetical protein [Granulicella rosea]SNT42141.1 hypothetical protein SAMN05421770_11328 [Granulicella rosea]
MLIELSKALSFALCLVSLHAVLASAFFEPDTTWPQRLTAGLFRLAIAACVCCASGLLFSYPARWNPDRDVSLWRTLPIRLFLWAAVVLSMLFALTWYLRCGGINSFGIPPDCLALDSLRRAPSPVIAFT